MASASAMHKLQIHLEYTSDLLPPIYGNEAPEFAEAFDSFNAVAMSLLTTL